MPDPQDFTVGWISAIPTEFVAAQQFLDEIYEEPEVAQHDDNAYVLGRIHRHNVVLAVMPIGNYGTTTAATVARNMLHSFNNIRISLMVGIGGGAPSAQHDIRLGDVVVSSHTSSREIAGTVFPYDHGKTIQDHEFQNTKTLNQAPELLLTAVGKLKTQYEMDGPELESKVAEALVKKPRLRKGYSRPSPDSDRLFRSDITHQTSCIDECTEETSYLVSRTRREDDLDDPTVHYGLVASANQLMKDAVLRDKFAAKGVLCFEMEAAGLANHFPCLIIRGICDYADSHKNKRWQGFAAMTAAAYSRDLLRQIAPNKVAAERRIEEALGNIGKQISDVHQTALTIRERSDMDQIERWLCAPDPSANANRAKKLRFAGTGLWFIHSSEFQSWLSGTRRHLWLSGFAGCGKTVLSSTILEYLAETVDTVILRFFFDFSDITKQPLGSLMRSLAWQLYQLHRPAADMLYQEFVKNKMGHNSPDSERLVILVSQMLICCGKVIIVLDAMDESTTKPELVAWIQTVVSDSRLSSTQFILTARPESVFISEIPLAIGSENCLQLDEQNVDTDIASYVAAKLAEPRFKDKSLPRGILDMIQSKVGGGAQGMFRWAFCQLETLAKCQHIAAVKAALSDLPADLDKTYARMIDSIPSNLRSDAFRLLHFILHSHRPLSLAEAIEVVATEVTDEKAHFDIERRVFRGETLLEYCPGLVTITGYYSKEVRLAHFSIKEYLSRIDLLGRQTASSSITRTCLGYLSGIQATYHVDDANWQEFPMARYAARAWLEHASIAETEDKAFTACINFLLNTKGFERWARFYDPGPSDHRTPLYYACLKGLLRTAEWLIKQRRELYCSNSNEDSSVYIASDGVNVKTTALRLRRSTEVNAIGGKYGYALQAASFTSLPSIIQLLLAHDADPNLQGGHYTTALCAAAASRRSSAPEVTKLLLNGGAKVNMRGSAWGTPLQTASKFGLLTTVELLLEHGADVHAQSDQGANALQLASLRGDEQIARLLLDHGADPGATTRWGRSAIGLAAENGCTEVVILLVSKGQREGVYQSNEGTSKGTKRHRSGGPRRSDQASQNNADDDRDPLFFAARFGHLQLVSELLSTGLFHCLQENVFGTTALFAAVANGHDDVVEHFVSSGLPEDLGNTHSRSLLWWARRSGSKRTFELIQRHTPVDVGGTIEDDVEIWSPVFRSTTAWCDICTLCIGSGATYHHCESCSGGGFVMCELCFEAGRRCLDTTHVPAKVQPFSQKRYHSGSSLFR